MIDLTLFSPGYCAECSYPLRRVGRDVLTGEHVDHCDGCGWRSDTEAKQTEDTAQTPLPLDGAA